MAAEDRETSRKVAIKKVSNFEETQGARQLLREIHLLRHFRGHENILTIKVTRVRHNESHAPSSAKILTRRHAVAGGCSRTSL